MLRIVLLFALLSLMLCSAQANDNPLKLYHFKPGDQFLTVLVTRDCKLIFGSTDEKTFTDIGYIKNGKEIDVGNLISFGNPLKKADRTYRTSAIEYYQGDTLFLPTANLFIKEDKLLETGHHTTLGGRAGYYFDKADHAQKVQMFPPVLIYENGKLLTIPGSGGDPSNDGASGSNSRSFYDGAKNSKLRGMFGRR